MQSNAEPLILQYEIWYKINKLCIFTIREFQQISIKKKSFFFFLISRIIVTLILRVFFFQTKAVKMQHSKISKSIKQVFKFNYGIGSDSGLNQLFFLLKQWVTTSQREAHNVLHIQMNLYRKMWRWPLTNIQPASMWQLHDSSAAKHWNAHHVLYSHSVFITFIESPNIQICC